MKKSRSQGLLVSAFVFAQLAWMGLLGLWIYWYVSNMVIFKQVGDKLAPKILIEGPNVFIFVGGIILIVGIAIAIFFIFRHLTIQLKLTNLYDNFIANVTHELKSPLSSIQMYLETMDRKEVPADKRKEFLGLMMKDALRLKKNINSILEVTRLEQKNIAHNFQVYNAGIVIPQLVHESAEHFRLNPTLLRFEGSATGKCVIDKDAIQIVFDNLTDNAIKYSVNSVEIAVKLSQTKRRIIVEFCDKGIGIEPKSQKKVFHKFHRINNKNIPNVKGTGLGLFWVREILKFHHGKIYVVSEGNNKGASFNIELPIYYSYKRFYFNSLLRKAAKKEKILGGSDGE
jgi:two-component system, OmpR family, phosphate regulon sensor histidine kinase PhoR